MRTRVTRHVVHGLKIFLIIIKYLPENYYSLTVPKSIRRQQKLEIKYTTTDIKRNIVRNCIFQFFLNLLVIELVMYVNTTSRRFYF